MVEDCLAGAARKNIFRGVKLNLEPESLMDKAGTSNLGRVPSGLRLE